MRKASTCDGILAELFQVLKDDAVKVLHTLCQQIWNIHPWPQDSKSQFSFQFQGCEWKDTDSCPTLCNPMDQRIHGILQRRILEWVAFHFSRAIPKKGNARGCSNYHTIALVSHASKVMLKILQARLQQCMNREFPDLEKAEEPEIKLKTSGGSQKKQENARKTSTSVSLTMLKPLTVWITTKCGKFLKRWEYQTTLPAS